MKLCKLLAALILCSSFAFAGASSLTATITDSNGNPYAGGSYTISFVYPSGSDYITTNGQNVVRPKNIVGTLDSNGAMAVSLLDNATVFPAGSQWSFSICSSDGLTCFNSAQTVTGGQPSLSAALSAASTILPASLSRSVLALPAGTASFPSMVIPAGVAPTTPKAGSIWMDSTHKDIGFSPCASCVQYSVNTYGAYQGTTSVPITDTAFHALVAAASDIAIPASQTVAGKVYRIHGDGVYTTAAASLLNVEVMLCTVSGCASGTVVAPAGCAVTTTNQANVLANGQFSFDCTLVATSTVGATGTFMAKDMTCAELGSAVTAASSCFNDSATAASTAVDETVQEFVNPAFKFTSSNAGNSAILLSYRVDVGN